MSAQDEFVPVIDLSSRDTDEGRAAVAATIGRACETSGFLTVVGHGVAPERVRRRYRTTETDGELGRVTVGEWFSHKMQSVYEAAA